MGDLNKALSDIRNIRIQLAAGTVFQGFGPAVMALTGGLALATAVGQTYWPDYLAPTDNVMLLVWVATAVVCVALIGFEMIARSRRHHGGLADIMLMNAVEVFLPAGFAGAAVGVVIMKYSPGAQWMLPGLWSVFMALGVFAAIRSLPKSVAICGAWYFVSGVGVLLAASSSQSLSPWMMGVPFAVGQFLMAFLLHTASGDSDAG